MKTNGKILLALLVSCFSMASLSEATLQIEGSVAAGPVAGPITANPNTNRVYESGGYAQNPATVYNVSNPAAPVIVTTVSGSGLSVNPNTNQYFTSSGFGGTIQAFDGATDAVFQSIGIGYCGGMSDIDVTNNRLYMTSQCGGGNDPLHVYDPASNSIIAGPLGSGGVVSTPYFNPANGYVYVLSSFGVRAFNGFPGYAVAWDLPGRVAVGVNQVTGELLVVGAGGTSTDIFNGTTGALIKNVAVNPGQWTPTVAVNKVLKRLYISDQTNQLIHVVDAYTYAPIEDFSLGAGIYPMGRVGVNETTSRIYVRGSDNIFYVLHDVVIPPSLTISPASGTFIATQNFDLALIIKGQGVSVVGGSAQLDGKNITQTIMTCARQGTLLDGGRTFRCPGLNAGGALKVGQHTLNVSLTLSDSSVVSDVATWAVLGSTEP